MAAGVANGPGCTSAGAYPCSLSRRLDLRDAVGLRCGGDRLVGWTEGMPSANAARKAPVGDEAVGRAHAAVSVSNRGLRARGSTYHMFCRNKCCHNILVFHDPTERVIFSQA